MTSPDDDTMMFLDGEREIRDETGNLFVCPPPCGSGRLINILIVSPYETSAECLACGKHLVIRGNQPTVYHDKPWQPPTAG